MGGASRVKVTEELEIGIRFLLRTSLGRIRDSSAEKSGTKSDDDNHKFVNLFKNCYSCSNIKGQNDTNKKKKSGRQRRIL